MSLRRPERRHWPPSRRARSLLPRTVPLRLARPAAARIAEKTLSGSVQLHVTCCDRVCPVLRWRLLLSRLLAGTALLVLANPGSAQDRPGFHFGISTGAAFPVGENPAGFPAAPLGRLELAYRFFNSELGVRLAAGYSRTSNAGPAHYVEVVSKVISGNADVFWAPAGTGAKPYFLGGLGFYDVRLSGATVGPFGGPTLPFDRAETHPGWNVGGGLSMPLRGSTWVSVEIRVESFHTETSELFSGSFTRVPLTVGLHF